MAPSRKMERLALLEQKVGSGRAICFAGTPGVSYIKEAKHRPLTERLPSAGV